MRSGWPGVSGRPTPATMPRSSSAPKPRVVTDRPVRPSMRLGRSGMCGSSATVGQYLVAKQSDGCHDVRMRRSTRVGMAQAQEAIVRASGLLPAMKLTDTGLRLAQDETILSQVVQGELR